MELVDRRRTLAALVVLLAIGLAAFADVAWLLRDGLLGAGPTAIHQPLFAVRDVHVCGRSYQAAGIIRTREEVRARSGFGPVLVDPALFAPCPPPDPNGAVPCTNVALATPCATVVDVRVGEDAYAEYSLRGGP